MEREGKLDEMARKKLIQALEKQRFVVLLDHQHHPKKKIIELIDAGMQIARFNFSYADHKTFTEYADNLKEAMAERKGTTVSIMLDTKGPEIRTGILRDAEPLSLKEGQELDVLTDFSLEGDNRRITISYQALPDTVKVGDKIVIDEGQLVLEVRETLEDTVKVVVMNDHILGEHKDVVLPGCQIDLPVLTEKDEIDIYDFGFKENIDIVACSFTRKEADIDKVSDFLGEKRSTIKIFAKISCKESLDNYEALLKASDGVVLCRGDLAKEIPSEKVFLAQKWMISEANSQGKPVIICNEILESMVRKPRPTRGEAGDIAGLILDGADCVMLTHETSIGKYPINATKMLSKICCEAEKTVNYRRVYDDVNSKSQVPFKFSETVASSIGKTSLDLKIGILIVFTESGKAARILAKYKPRQPIFVCSLSLSVRKQMNSVRGTIAFAMNQGESKEECIARVIAFAKERGMCADGTKAIVQTTSDGSGLKDDPAEECNMMKVYDI